MFQGLRKEPTKKQVLVVQFKVFLEPRREPKGLRLGALPLREIWPGAPLLPLLGRHWRGRRRTGLEGFRIQAYCGFRGFRIQGLWFRGFRVQGLLIHRAEQPVILILPPVRGIYLSGPQSLSEGSQVGWSLGFMGPNCELTMTSYVQSLWLNSTSVVNNIGALIIRTGVWGPLRYTILYNQELPKQYW